VDVASSRPALRDDIKNMQVHVLDSAQARRSPGSASPATSPASCSTDNIAVGPDETLYVTDTTNFRIQQFTLDGEFIRRSGDIGTSPDSLHAQGRRAGSGGAHLCRRCRLRERAGATRTARR